jgi:RND family efflux transporter MFP subunit
MGRMRNFFRSATARHFASYGSPLGCALRGRRAPTFPPTAMNARFHRWTLLAILASGSSLAVGDGLDFDGFVEPTIDAQVASAELGRIDEVLVRVGDRVTAGQGLIRLDDDVQATMLEIAVQSAQMTGALVSAEAEVQLQRDRQQRTAKLAESGNARPDELRRVEADLQIALARLQQAVEEQKLRELEVERYREQLDRRIIEAPFDGLIARIMKDQGEFVSPSDPIVVRLVAIDVLEARVNLPSAIADQIQPGDTIPTRIGESTNPIDGTVLRIAPVIDAESGTVEARVRIDNQEGKIRAGDRCVIHIQTSNQGPSSLAVGE